MGLKLWSTQKMTNDAKPITPQANANGQKFIDTHSIPGPQLKFADQAP